MRKFRVGIFIIFTMIFYPCLSLGDYGYIDLRKEDPEFTRLTTLAQDILEKVYQHETEKLLYLVHPKVPARAVDSRISPEDMRELLIQDAKKETGFYYKVLYSVEGEKDLAKCSEEANFMIISPYLFFRNFGVDFEISIAKENIWYFLEIEKHYGKCNVKLPFPLEFIEIDGKFYINAIMFDSP